MDNLGRTNAVCLSKPKGVYLTVSKRPRTDAADGSESGTRLDFPEPRVPSLQFKGKSVIETHHHTVPHHRLEFDAKLSLLLRDAPRGWCCSGKRGSCGGAAGAERSERIHGQQCRDSWIELGHRNGS